MIKKLFMNILNYGADPRSYQAPRSGYCFIANNQYCPGILKIGSGISVKFQPLGCTLDTDPWSIAPCQVATVMDLGSVSTGYSDRPVARAIKIKHAGLNLTGRAPADLFRKGPQASSLTAGLGYYRMDLERNNYGQRQFKIHKCCAGKNSGSIRGNASAGEEGPGRV